MLVGASVLGLSTSLLPVTAIAKTTHPTGQRPPQLLVDFPQQQQDAVLLKHVKKVVVIYAENRSFTNLFAYFPGTDTPLADCCPTLTAQRDRDGSLLPHLPPIWNGLVPNPQVVNHINYHIEQNADFTSQMPNRPFRLQGFADEHLPQGVVTRDLWHVFYQNQMQINNGRNDKFVAWADSGALPMGYYADNATNLRLWNLARNSTLCDHFFKGAYGGSFLNRQYLVCANRLFTHKSPVHRLTHWLLN